MKLSFSCYFLFLVLGPVCCFSVPRFRALSGLKLQANNWTGTFSKTIAALSDHNNALNSEQILPEQHFNEQNKQASPVDKTQHSYGHLFKSFLDLSFVEKFIRKFLSLLIIDPDMLKIVSKGLSIAFWVFAGLSFLGTMGVDTKPFLSLVSISGLTIGFAARDILTNTFAGLFLLFSRPFVRGSVISTCGYTGTVLSVDLRYVKLACDVNNHQQVVLIPLNMVYSGVISVQKYE